MSAGSPTPSSSAAYEFRADLPKTATGKVRKFVLRDEAKALQLY